MSKILRLDMTKKEIKVQEVPKKYELLGGRGLTSQIICDEVLPTCHPLGKYNKLVIAHGLFTGTKVPSSGRLSVGAKSPLTGTIKESNAGGITSQKLANLGIRAIVIEGKPDDGKLYLLKITEEGIELLPADNLLGKGTYEVTQILRNKYSTKAGVITIGPAGEMLMQAAGVTNNDSDGNSSRYAARGGLGAVMGSKGLKAIVVDSDKTFDAPVREKEKFNAGVQRFTDILLSHPTCGKGLPKYGTIVLMSLISEAGALPTKNFSRGRFEKVADVSARVLAKNIELRGGKSTHPCHPGCVIRCSSVYPMPDGKVCAPIEYETAWAFGPNLEISDLDIIAKLNYICNDVGLDTIEIGGALGVLAETGVISFGDGEAAVKVLEEVYKKSYLARIVGQGAEFVGKAFGITRVAAVKGQHLPACDPRGAKGIGVTYATSTMGADHTAGFTITANLLKCGGFVDPLKPDGQVVLSRDLQVLTAAIDSTGLCLFVNFALLDNKDGLPTVIEMLNAQYGIEFTIDDFKALGQHILKAERDFNLRAGFTVKDDRLPEFFYTEELPPHNTVYDVKDDELDKIFIF